MAIKLIDEKLKSLQLFEGTLFGDERGFFMESYRQDELARYGLKENFVQDNHSGSVKNTLRGLHFQWNKPQGKLIRVSKGEAMFVEVDIREQSRTFGKYEKFILSEANRHILWVPPGFANGFLVLSEWCEVQYKCTAYYNPDGEGGILWNDPELGIDWGCSNPIISERDRKAMTLRDWLAKPESKIFT
ncbi:dTDP-4-dehydrorhamnose 3,5-epimerase [Bacteroidetes/Chlorobi group bacterium ChocPot_Mid]|jgi:dTDP-4-dehydrorhamnose 3,5-epimerase|nr:MAG: dTDP-4-dehydrorhamnose 3,5-epimerase [Bacteroidetes/Chlorobi group bacterium ChocPot_Mid]